MKGTFQFLGTSASAGVPLIGCKCAVCTSPLPTDKRFRPSGLIRMGGKTLLLDVGPDFRSQALRAGIAHLDGLLLTHTHYDHIAGIDDLRIFNTRQKKPMPCLLSAESLEEIRKRYAYFFKSDGWSAKFDFTIFPAERGTSEFLGLRIGYCSFMQNDMKVTGFRFGDFAYISDIKKYDESMFEILEGVDQLVVSALKAEPSPYHLSFEEAILFARKAGARQTWITHVNHSQSHDAMNALLPPEVRMAYDGLTLEFACMK